MAYLTVRTKGDDGHSYFELDPQGGRIVVGRSDEAELTIDSERISRQHCALSFEDGAWWVEDLDSANGTRVNADKVSTKTRLSERDVVKAGDFRGTFHDGEPPKKRRKTSKPAEIEIDGEVGSSGGTAPTRERGIDDPADATPCEHCRAWLSVAHRVPGDRLTCPACGKVTTVPQLV